MNDENENQKNADNQQESALQNHNTQNEGEVNEGKRQNSNDEGTQTGTESWNGNGNDESASRTDEQTSQGQQYQNAMTQRDDDQNDPDSQGGSMATDGPVSQNEGRNGNDLDDIGEQLKGSDADYAATEASDFNDEQNKDE